MTQDEPFGTSRDVHGYSRDHESLANAVIDILKDRQVVCPTGARQIAVDYLVRAVLADDGFDAALVLEELCAYRLTHDALIDLYIPKAAEYLGAQWMTSDLDFATVTVGSLRLQALLGVAAHGLTREPVDNGSVLHALVVVPEAEQHFLGASVVAAQLRRLGCDVSLSINEATDKILARVEYDQPDMVLFSCARAAGLETATGTVKKIRQISDPVPVLAIGGAYSGINKQTKEETGVDLVTHTAKDVVGFTTKRKKALGRR